MKLWKLKTLLSLGAAVALVAGCSGGDSQNSSSSDGATRISMIAKLHVAEAPSDKLEKLLEEKTNTELDIQWVPNTIYEDKINAAFATGALPMTFSGDINKFREAILDGQFWEIGPYLQEFDNLKNLDPGVLKNMEVEDKMYSLYAERPLSRQGLIFRKDWADNLGLSTPTNLDELYELLRQFKNNDPDQNGKDDTIGLTDRSDMVFGAFKTVASWHGTPNYWGEKDGQLLPEFMFPEYMETMRFFKKLHTEGLINQDFPVTSKEDQRALMVSGKAGAYIGSMPDAWGLQTDLAEVNPNGVLDVQNRIEGPHGLGIWMATQGGGEVQLFPKSAIQSEDQLKKVLSFFDQLMSPEVANLALWGVEGEHYTVVDGLAKPIEDTKKLNREVKPYVSIAVGGEMTIPDRLRAKWEDPVKQKAEDLVLDNNEFLIENPASALESKTFTEMGVRLQQLINDATFKFILGEIDEAGFQKVVDKWLADGGQRIIDEYTADYSASK